MRLSRSFWSIAWLLVAQLASAQTLVFKRHGKSVATLTLAELSAKIAQQEVQVWEPHEKREKKYTGFDTQKIFSLVYGPTWTQAEDVLFTCSDGYKPSIPILKFKAHKSYLMFKGAEASFKVVNSIQNNEHVDLGPFYLAWDNRTNEVLRNEGAMNWPYQITTIDLIRFSEQFPNTAPPLGASDEVKAGFLVFRTTCMHCHTLNGEGASKAPELNYPVSVMDYWKKDWLEKWILDPTSIRFNSTMPSLRAMDASPEKTVKSLLSYLEAMAKVKHQPTSFSK